MLLSAPVCVDRKAKQHQINILIHSPANREANRSTGITTSSLEMHATHLVQSDTTTRARVWAADGISNRPTESNTYITNRPWRIFLCIQNRKRISIDFNRLQTVTNNDNYPPKSKGKDAWLLEQIIISSHFMLQSSTHVFD